MYSWPWGGASRMKSPSRTATRRVNGKGVQLPVESGFVEKINAAWDVVKKERGLV